MKIGLAQVNTTIGDLQGNLEKILKAYRDLCSQGAELVVFSELTLSAYPPKDLLLRPSFLINCEAALNQLAKSIHEVPAIIGFPQHNPQPKQRLAFNAVAWCQNQKILHIAQKCLLPTYDVFDEDRYFNRGHRPLIVSFKNKKIGLTICEDIWTGDFLHRQHIAPLIDPVDCLAQEKIDLLINISASPWHYGKEKTREILIKKTAERCHCPVVYCNQVGAQDELIFDGQSLVCNSQAQIIAELPAFEESNTVVDLNQKPPDFALKKSGLSPIGKIYKGLTLGLHDYVVKSGFKKVLLGLSGGIDSAVTACIAVNALGSENVLSYSLPSAISSDHSQIDALELAQNLGITYQTLPINKIIDTFESTLAPVFKEKARDITEENLQARARGVLLMAISNKLGALLLTTSNKSELAVGYCTIYGDMTGGLAVLSDVPKTKVYELAHYINRETELIPQNSIEKPPSAELSLNQTDQDALPPYEILDAIITAYIEENLSPKEIAEKNLDHQTVIDIIKRIDSSEYKRKQAAPGLKITPLAFGVGRRMPLVQKYTHSK